jgi:hypothetical protein
VVTTCRAKVEEQGIAEGGEESGYMESNKVVTVSATHREGSFGGQEITLRRWSI